jgi:hypothetical protein
MAAAAGSKSSSFGELAQLADLLQRAIRADGRTQGNGANTTLKLKTDLIMMDFSRVGGNQAGQATDAELFAHEAGHNAAEAHIHREGFDYHDEGLSSNETGLIYPTRTNTRMIVNDSTNRKTLDNP